MNIIKHCKCCGVQFVAHRMATLYCSKACNAKATRVRKKKNLEKEYQELQDDIELSQETTAAPAEFLKQQYCLGLVVLPYIGMHLPGLSKLFNSEV